MRLNSLRTVTAPTQCADLEASPSQYFSKTTPAGMTLTDDLYLYGMGETIESYVVGGAISVLALRVDFRQDGWANRNLCR